MARDLTTGNKTEPVPYTENPAYNEKDGSPKFLPDEPHININLATNADEKPLTVQTGYVRGGTTNPPEGQSGEVERVAFNDVTDDFVHGGGVAGVKSGKDSDGRTKVNPNDDVLVESLKVDGTGRGTNTVIDGDGNATVTTADDSGSKSKGGKKS